jgi:peptidoglycan/xylan/chitin deacetylase (PgdA/CDA1 family)
MTPSLIDRFRHAPQPAIMMYHRVASPALDPWEIAVSASCFEDQIAALANRRSVMSMEEFAARQMRGDLPRDAVALTFDDGYVDNIETALPLLVKRGVPATFFVPTAYVGRAREFWWDELARLVMQHPGGARWDLPALGRRVEFGDDDHLAGSTAWRGWDAPKTRRQAIFHDVWAELKLRPLAETEAALRELAAQSAAPTAMAADYPATAVELARATASGLVAIEGHTHTHRPLAAIAIEQAGEEMAIGRQEGERLSGRAIAGLAYPYGNCNAAVASAARNAGFTWACTTREAVVRRRDDAMLLPRVAARNETGEQLLRRLDDLTRGKA